MKDDETIFSISMLWLACEEGSMENVQTLLERGANIDHLAVTSSGVAISCLNKAADGGHLEIVQYLISNNAKVVMYLFLLRTCQTLFSGQHWK